MIEEGVSRPAARRRRVKVGYRAYSVDVPSTRSAGSVGAWSDLAELVMALVDRLPPNGTRRVLALGPMRKWWQDALGEHGVDTVVEEDLSMVPEATVDLVCAFDVLERAPWDRWLLQETHRVLRDGGHLVLAVPNLFALASARDVARMASHLTAKIWRHLRPSPAVRERFGRRYRLADLIDMLERLGFAVSDCRPDFGWFRRIGRLQPSVLANVAGGYILTCARHPSLFGLDARRPYPDPAGHVRFFEQARRASIETRDRWFEQHPEHRAERAAPIDPRAYGGAAVLVLAPHPDDEIIGCGGTLARMIAHGARVTVLHATDGSDTASLRDAPADVRRTVRLEEARAVGELMGFQTLDFWREDNAAFREREELVQRLVGLLARVRPAAIFTPFVTDDHPDHRVLGRLLQKALRDTANSWRDTRVLAYEVWNLVPANRYCDVTDTVLLQERALLRYATAMKAEDYVHICQDRNFYNAHVMTGRPGFAEAFFETDVRSYVAVVEAGERDDG